MRVATLGLALLLALPLGAAPAAGAGSWTDEVEYMKARQAAEADRVARAQRERGWSREDVYRDRLERWDRHPETP